MSRTEVHSKHCGVSGIGRNRLVAAGRFGLAVPGEVTRLPAKPLEDVVAGPSGEQDSGVSRPNGPAYEQVCLEGRRSV
jgi:hypothetical protein